MAVTTSGLVYEWVGKKAAGSAPHTNADADKATWYGNVGSLNIGLSGLSTWDWTATDGWVGAGTAADPYALHADGSSHASSRSTTATNANWQDTSFTLEQWICPEAYVPGDTGNWFTNIGNTGYGFRVYTASTESSVGLIWGADGASWSYLDLKVGYTIGAWAHMALTYNGSGSPASGALYTYWNNAQTSQGTVNYYPNTTAAVLPMFADNSTHGSIATVRWYSRALSAAEVQANYESGPTVSSTDVWTGLTIYHPS